MTTYYVGPGGNNANDGLSWANRKLTLNGAEDIPVAAGDTVYVGPGTYREQLNIDVSGSAGNPITYIGDYSGLLTDGIGGVVRITGSDDDITITRANCIAANNRSFRTFIGFAFDLTSAQLTACSGSGGNWIIDKCVYQANTNSQCYFAGTGVENTVRNCFFYGYANHTSIVFSHTATVDAPGHLVENCILIGGVTGISFTRIGNSTVKNCTFMGRQVQAVNIATSPSAGQTITVNNCIIYGCSVGLNAQAVGEITEDYNAFFSCTTNRTNVNTGAHSNAYPPLFDIRPFFELVK
jgi:hypothetical protein